MMSYGYVRLKSPTAGLEALNDLPPLHLEVQRLAIQALGRVELILNPTWDGLGRLSTRKGHRRYLLDLRTSLHLPLYDWDEQEPEERTIKDYVVEVSSFLTGRPGRGSLTCYTDGSCISNRVGAGVALYR